MSLENRSKFSLQSLDSKNILVIVLSVILVALAVVYFIQRSEHREIINQLGNEKDSLSIELQQMLVENDTLKVSNEQLNDDLLVTNEKIKNLLVEIEQVKKVSYKEIQGYQRKVTTLKKVMKDLYLQIDSLNERNKVLFAENQEVKQLFNEEKVRAERLEKEKEKLEQTVIKAQMLEAINLTGVGLTPRKRETNKVARTQQLQISFTLSKNLTAKRGSRNVYMRIMNPAKKLLKVSDDNVFEFESSKIVYSAMREINYEGMELPINIYWDNTGNPTLLPGIYTVDVFTDGYNIGTTTFVMRQ